MVLPVYWCYKSCVGGKPPFAVVWREGHATEGFFNKAYLVTRTEFDSVAETLGSFPFPGFPRTAFLMTDGERWMAVNPEGYDYPRYKSLLPPEAQAFLRALIPKFFSAKVLGAEPWVLDLGNSAISPFPFNR